MPYSLTQLMLFVYVHGVSLYTLTSQAQSARTLPNARDRCVHSFTVPLSAIIIDKREVGYNLKSCSIPVLLQLVEGILRTVATLGSASPVPCMDTVPTREAFVYGQYVY